MKSDWRRKPEAGPGGADEARHHALGLLARREHSRRELERKLAGRGWDAACVERVLDDLAREGALSETRFTEAYVRSRRERGFGPLRIEAELRERGVPGELVDAALDAGDPDWVTVLARVCEKRFGPRPAADRKERARQARFLQQRGFTHEQIRKVLA